MQEHCDIILLSDILALPDMLILSLKHIDLDYNMLETVKFNRRCAFCQTLNMKSYTLEGAEAFEKLKVNIFRNTVMDTGKKDFNPLSSLPNENYKNGLAGILVDYGVDQGGH